MNPLAVVWAVAVELGKAIPIKVWLAGAAMLAIFFALHMAEQRGAERAKHAAQVEAGKRIVEMEKTNETFRNLSAHDRCLAFMRDSGLPANHCD